MMAVEKRPTMPMMARMMLVSDQYIIESKGHGTVESHRKPPKRLCVRVYVSANNGDTVTFTVSVDELTERLNLSEEDISDAFNRDIIVEVSLSVVDELNDDLVCSNIEHDVADGSGLNVGRLDEH